MRAALALILVGVLAPAASADRGMAVDLGLTGDARAIGHTFGETANSGQLSKLAGARLTLAFEDDLLAFPAPDEVDTDLRLVPELFTGFLADDVHAEGMVGAGLRGELQIASTRHNTAVRTGIYVAARAIAIGKHQDGATEFMLGEWISLSGGRRFGWEGGAMLRPRQNQGEHELDALLSIYYGWR